MPGTFVFASSQYLSLDNTTTGSGTGTVVTPTLGLTLDFTSGSALTVAAWVKLTDLNRDYDILAKNQDSYANGAYLLRYNKDTNSLDWIVSTYTGSFTASIPAPSSIKTAASGILVVAQWVAGDCSIAVNNGAFVHASTVANITREALQFTGTAHDSVALDTHVFTIGNDPTNPNATYMNGQIGSVGVWDRQLTAVEVTALYNTGHPVLFAALTTQVTNCAAYWDLDADALDDSQFGNSLTDHGTVTYAVGWS